MKTLSQRTKSSKTAHEAEKVQDPSICVACRFPKRPRLAYSEREIIMPSVVRYCECDHISEE